MRENCLYIVPDVHGRVFWKEAIKEIPSTKVSDSYTKLDNYIVFLGDYLDPYPHECISEEEAIENFKEILEFKKKYPNQVKLLLGNHDAGYIWPDVCSCRRIKRYYNDIRNLFLENMDLFDLAFGYNTNNKKYVFTHSGVHKGWIDLLAKDYGFKYSKENICIVLDNLLHNEEYFNSIDSYLGIYSYYRGYTSDRFGSCIWADVREWSNEEPNKKETDTIGIYQIFGHTQLELAPIIRDTFACIDVRRYFILTDDDKLIDPQYPLGEWEWDLKKEQ